MQCVAVLALQCTGCSHIHADHGNVEHSHADIKIRSSTNTSHCEGRWTAIAVTTAATGANTVTGVLHAAAGALVQSLQWQLVALSTRHVETPRCARGLSTSKPFAETAFAIGWNAVRTVHF